MEDVKGQIGSRGRLFTTVILFMLAVLQLFLVHMIIALHRDVRDQRSELVTKSDLINLAVNLGPSDPAMASLNGVCTSCHTAHCFMDPHAELGDIPALVRQMASHEEASISGEQLPRIEAALTFLKCAHCHSGERLKEMAILDARQRWELIMQMSARSGAGLTQEDARRIRDSYGDLWNWAMP